MSDPITYQKKGGQYYFYKDGKLWFHMTAQQIQKVSTLFYGIAFAEFYEELPSHTDLES